VIISPPFWKTWWFQAALFLIVVAAVGGTVRSIEMRKIRRRMLALEQQHALERERLRISMDMHDEVGTSLTKIAIMSELAMGKHDEAEATKKELSEISRATRETIDSIGAIIWAINPANNRLDDLLGYIRDSASEYLERTGMKYSFDFPHQIQSHQLSTEVRRTIFLTVKEAIHNAVKHSDATTVRLSCRVTGSDVQFSVEDNGNGFIVDQVRRNGQGLNNMTKRASEVQGVLTIESALGGGTRIQLVVPLT